MNKIWKFKESKSNKLILIRDKTIFKGNPNENDLNRLNSETTELTFLKDLFSIPYSYIKKIENQKGWYTKSLLKPSLDYNGLYIYYNKYFSSDMKCDQHHTLLTWPISGKRT